MEIRRQKREGSGDRHYNSNLYNKEWETSYSSRKKMEEKAEAGKWTPQKDTDGRLKNKHGKNYESFVTDYNKAIDQEIASATTEEEKEAAKAKKIAMSASTKRLWPEQSSATKQEMKTPDAKQYQHSERQSSTAPPSIWRENPAAAIWNRRRTPTDGSRKRIRTDT